MYGREDMYVGSPRGRRLPAEGDRSEVIPVGKVLAGADERQFCDHRFAWTFEFGPALARRFQRAISGVHGFKLDDREMRHVGPLLVVEERAGIERVVQLANTVRRERHADEHRWRDRHEILHVAERHLEGRNMTADLLHERDGFFFGSAELAGRQDGDVGR